MADQGPNPPVEAQVTALLQQLVAALGQVDQNQQNMGQLLVNAQQAQATQTALLQTLAQLPGVTGIGATAHPGTSVKVNPPEKYNGNREKYTAFLSACNLNFTQTPNSFATDAQKIAYLGSYLEGTPRDWFNTLFDLHTQFVNLPPGALANDIQTAANRILTNWMDFMADFKMFADPNPEGTARTKLKALKQRGPATNYANEFRSWAFRLDMTDASRRDDFYDGLKPAVKDMLSNVERPKTFAQMVTSAIQADDRVHQRRLEQVEEGKSSGTSGAQKSSASSSSTERRPPLAPTSTHTFSPPPGPPPPPFRPVPPRSGPSMIRPAGPSSGPVPMELDAAGRPHLTQAERERRIRLNLCLRCGRPGHRAQNCTTRGSANVSAVDVDDVDDQSENGQPSA